jgi:hypothetical protein
MMTQNDISTEAVQMSGTLSNSFHGTTISVRDLRRSYDLLCADRAELSKSERAHARRVRLALCPSADEGCACGVVRS